MKNNILKFAVLFFLFFHVSLSAQISFIEKTSMMSESGRRSAIPMTISDFDGDFKDESHDFFENINKCPVPCKCADIVNDVSCDICVHHFEKEMELVITDINWWIENWKKDQLNSSEDYQKFLQACRKIKTHQTLIFRGTDP